MKSCRSTHTVVEDAHAPTKHASVASTPSAASGSRYSLQEGAAWSSDRGSISARKRASSLESWLRKPSGADKEARRAARRAKRKAFFRKLFFLPPSPEEEEEEKSEAQPQDAPLPSTTAGVAQSDDAPNDDGSAYKLNDTYYASMASILNQYKTDCMSENGDEDESETEKEDYDTSDLDSNTDMSEISVFDLEEDTDDDTMSVDELDERDEDGLPADYALVPIPETELVEETGSPSGVKNVVREMPVYVVPPVRVPMDYTLADRRGGTLVGGRHVLFTSAAFKRKQRQMLYGMRPVPEDAQYIVPQIRDDDDSDDELNTSGVYALQNEWV